MMGIAQTATAEGSGRAGVMIPVPGYSMYQARLLQHNSYQVTGSFLYYMHVIHQHHEKHSPPYNNCRILYRIHGSTFVDQQQHIRCSLILSLVQF